MPMSLWGGRFPAIASAETRSIRVFNSKIFPIGNYGFVEYFCDEIDCDCRRAIIQVVCESTRPKIWATISYGWEPPEFYKDWMGDPDWDESFSGVVLDAMSLQSEYAIHFLADFMQMLETDQAYADRIQRHYMMFKASLKQEPTKQNLSLPVTQWTPPRKSKFR